MDSIREQWHRDTTIKENVGVTNTERLIKFILPDSNVKCTYPPKGYDADVAAINLRKEWESKGKDLYPTFEEFMQTLKVFIPYESYTEVGIYTNFKYEKWVYSHNVKMITRKKKNWFVIMFIRIIAKIHIWSDKLIKKLYEN